jgi:hypothetical protein
VIRSKQIADRARGDGQARSLSNLQINTRYLSPGYQLITHDLSRGDTGLLSIFSLVPTTTGKPTFQARLDDGSPGNRREPELDIDIKGVTAAVEIAFKNNRDGFAGHHSNRSPNQSHRIFDVEIVTPAGQLFDGEVSFNAAFSLELNVHINSTLTADASVIHASWAARIINALRRAYVRTRKLFGL